MSLETSYKVTYDVGFMKAARAQVQKEQKTILVSVAGANSEVRFLLVGKAICLLEGFVYSDDEADESLANYGIMVFRKKSLSSDSFVMTHPGESYALSLLSIEEVGEGGVLENVPVTKSHSVEYPPTTFLPPFILPDINEKLVQSPISVSAFDFEPIFDRIAQHTTHDKLRSDCIELSGELTDYTYEYGPDGEQYPTSIGCLKCYLTRIQSGYALWNPKFKLTLSLY